MSNNIDLRRESLWCICNAITSCDDILAHQIGSLHPDLIRILVLGTNLTGDKRLVLNLIEAIDKMFLVEVHKEGIEIVRSKFE